MERGQTMPAMNLNYERTIFESSFKVRADALIERAKAAYDNAIKDGGKTSWDRSREVREQCSRELDAVKRDTVESLEKVFDRARDELAKAWGKPMNAAQTSALEAAKIGVNSRNITGLFAAAKGNAMAVSALHELVPSDMWFQFKSPSQAMPDSLDDLLKCVDKLQESREKIILNYGCPLGGEIQVSGPVAYLLIPGGQSVTESQIQAFLDEYSA